MRVLGIETSCDETAVAVYCGDRGLLSHALHSQAAMHAEHGGVVPELASRDHVRRLPGLADAALTEAGLAPHDIDAVAYTAGPGLIGALLVGASFARGLAHALGVPAVPVHHLEGHLLAPQLEGNAPAFPQLALLVSGGHTQIIAIRRFGHYDLLGESLDDAAGEAFDKVAKLLGLGYPGGPALERLAQTGNPERFRFPRPMTDRPGLDFSFSGLKTHTRVTLESHLEAGGGAARQGDAINAGAPDADPTLYADIARAFSDAVVDTFGIKLRRALKETGLRQVVAAGGVMANQALRSRLVEEAARVGAAIHFPRPAFCTDNAAMIALAGFERLRHDAVLEVNGARARWPLAELAED